MEVGMERKHGASAGKAVGRNSEVTTAAQRNDVG